MSKTGMDLIEILVFVLISFGLVYLVLLLRFIAKLPMLIAILIVSITLVMVLNLTPLKFQEQVKKIGDTHPSYNISSLDKR